MAKDARDVLKRMAEQAKNRLRERNQETKIVTKKRGFKVVYGGANFDVKTTIIKNDDNKLYEKVKNILTINSDIINPIAEIMDKKYYSSLSEANKEKYFFEMVEKYRKLKNQFEQEKRELV